MVSFLGLPFFQKRHGFKGFDIEKNVRAAEMIFFRNWHYFLLFSLRKQCAIQHVFSCRYHRQHTLGEPVPNEIWYNRLYQIVFQHDRDAKLLRELARNGQLRSLCGFNGK
ncbi:hypothetical protein P9G49_15295, partial [Heyndrickxia coagulans]|nr:hypothetical protein [Heyndrickxia coagulans]